LTVNIIDFMGFTGHIAAKVFAVLVDGLLKHLSEVSHKYSVLGRNERE
jgi:hypothetical protein